MDKLFSELEKKVRTKKEMTLYMKEIASAKEAVFKKSGKKKSEPAEIIKELFLVAGEEKNNLKKEKESLEKEREKLLEKEKSFIKKKEELEKKSVSSVEAKKKIKEEKREIEKKRRKVEEEAWELEDRIVDLENKLSEIEGVSSKKKKSEAVDPTEKLSILKKAEEYLSALPVVGMELPFNPEEDFLNDILKWLKEETGENFILDIKTNPDLIGGAIVEHKGKIADFSVAKELKKINFKEILEKQLNGG